MTEMKFIPLGPKPSGPRPWRWLVLLAVAFVIGFATDKLFLTPERLDAAEVPQNDYYCGLVEQYGVHIAGASEDALKELCASEGVELISL